MTDLSLPMADAPTLVDRIGALPDAPLAMPKQRIEPAPGGWARLLPRLLSLPRLSAHDRGR